MCGSFCTMQKAVDEMRTLSEQYAILPVMSQNVYETDTRFGKAKDFIDEVEKISGRQVLHSIVSTEPIGPKGLVDVMVVMPCTGNTLSKIANGITDTSVTMGGEILPAYRYPGGAWSCYKRCHGRFRNQYREAVQYKKCVSGALASG